MNQIEDKAKVRAFQLLTIIFYSFVINTPYSKIVIINAKNLLQRNIALIIFQKFAFIIAYLYIVARFSKS